MKTISPNRILAALLSTFVACISTPTANANDWPQWRGPKRDGVAQEKGLLSQWPASGPKLLWKSTEAGRGYSTPSVVGDRLYLIGNDGLENESVIAFSVKDGKRVWSTRLGIVGNPKQQPPFPAARSTPTIEGQFLYSLGSDGDLVCMELSSGTIRWQKNLRKDFEGKPGQWAYSESPLIDGDALICTPGGSKATMLSVNKKTGDTIWMSALPEADESGYASAIPVETGAIRQYVQLVQKGLIGVDAKTGKLLWRYGKAISQYGANIPTPVLIDKDVIFWAVAGTGAGAVKLTAKNGGVEAEAVYSNPKLPLAIGSIIKVGGYGYGTTQRTLECFDLATGNIKWEASSIGTASMCFADGRIYLHGENGAVALVEPSPDSYKEKGRFTPDGAHDYTTGMEKAWAYPIVANGHLFVRDHNLLWCYDVKQ